MLTILVDSQKDAAKVAAAKKAVEPLAKIIFLGVLGAVLIILLLVSWRRYNARLNRTRPEPDTPPDAWRAAADRIKIDEKKKDDDDEPNDESSLGR